VTFGYGEGRDALRGVSFTWRARELLALVGPNGSGKSTCVRAALGLGVPKHGRVLADGVPLNGVDLVRWRRQIAFLPQRAYLPPRSSVSESLRFVDTDVAETHMKEALERVGLLSALRLRSPDPLRLRVGDLSVGERQRVALARVICRQTPMVILDEPDANLDRDGIRLVADLVTELARDRMVLVVAHSHELVSLADHVVTLIEGEVRSDNVQTAKRAQVG
jgi:ABC-type multidrug transport system fused ATPase/permease subunit